MRWPTACASTTRARWPRTLAERRADALGALAAGNEHLGCACGSPTCDAPGRQASTLVVHLLVDQAAVDNAARRLA
ncbi:DUF222 domain-containing protein [Mycolicibacterium sp. ND9-15]|uniref:DUF222 domain-containing protein n=1 Tax=Mycolicibacterium sp. ND9-15 TaxID=3042320 RepID=UPI002DD91FE0|nr:DUF222 domain-containing protein [Mycolicibacterium sp. ND9-15]WSE58593.1 DUF222 domain-containing protein [Mycolicibacterium sp. ND9-15]